MKWVRGWMASAAAVLLAGSHGFGLAAKANTPADRAWAEAAKSDTLEGYAAFAIAHPESEHAAVAYAKLSSPEQRLRGDEGAPREMSGRDDDEPSSGLPRGIWRIGY
jgi:hypothetical protein